MKHWSNFMKYKIFMRSILPAIMTEQGAAKTSEIITTDGNDKNILHVQVAST